MKTGLWIVVGLIVVAGAGYYVVQNVSAPSQSAAAGESMTHNTDTSISSTSDDMMASSSVDIMSSSSDGVMASTSESVMH